MRSLLPFYDNIVTNRLVRIAPLLVNGSKHANTRIMSRFGKQLIYSELGFG